MNVEKSYINDNIPLYNSRIIDAYIKFIKKYYNHININEILSYAAMKSYEVADQEHWFNQKQINLFYEKVVQKTKNKNIALEAGRYAASPDAIGVMRQYVLGMVNPNKAFELIGKTAANFTKASSFASKRIDSNKTEITVEPKIGVKEEPFQCENRIGFFETIVLLFNNRLPNIEHVECIFKGGKKCRYIISWEKSFSSLYRKIRNILLLVLVPANLVFAIIKPLATLIGIFPVSLIAILALSLIIYHFDNKELKLGLTSLEDSKDKLLEQMKINYNDALMLNEIGQVLSQENDIEDALENVMSILKNRLHYDRCMILLTKINTDYLSYRAGYGYDGKLLGYVKNFKFHLDNPKSKGALVVSFKKQKPYLINDIDSIEEDLSRRSLEFVRKMKTRSFICCPIICDGKSKGILVVDNLISKRALIESDLSQLMGVAQVLGISIKNAELNESRILQFRSILQGLVASIDARDPLTAGHSEKVTRYAVGICNEMGTSKEFTDMISVAASLHDYGKIGVPDSLLQKKGKLTKTEYGAIQKHATKTKEILEQINFHGIYSQVPDVASSHHEKIDGTGYPNGLKGKQIPMGSQIIAVADFFEAITAKRHYRDPIPLDRAFHLLKHNSGKHFDKEIVKQFISYYLKSFRNGNNDNVAIACS
ncbi:HD domain-containing phosphohydrolase [Spirochaetota bacterium]